MATNTSGLNFGYRSHTGSRGKDNADCADVFAVQRGGRSAGRLDDDSTRLASDVEWSNVPAGNVVVVAVVADGVSSTNGSAQASRIAVEAVKASLQDPPTRQATLSEWLESAIEAANGEILFEARRNPQWAGMSTTLVLVALAGDKLYAMHVGDSRAYLLRDDSLHQLTLDHTWAQEAIDSGAISAEEGARHPGRNQLLRYLGTSKRLYVDRGLISPDAAQHEEYLLVQPGDAVLLCTDGLYRTVGEEAMRRTIHSHTGYPQDAVEELIEKAVAQGERDDITAVLIELPLDRMTWTPTARAPAPTTAADQPDERRSRRWLWPWLWVVALTLALMALYLFALR